MYKSYIILFVKYSFLEQNENHPTSSLLDNQNHDKMDKEIKIHENKENNSTTSKNDNNKQSKNESSSNINNSSKASHSHRYRSHSRSRSRSRHHKHHSTHQPSRSRSRSKERRKNTLFDVIKNVEATVNCLFFIISFIISTKERYNS